jgi:hypothetical protein
MSASIASSKKTADPYRLVEKNGLLVIGPAAGGQAATVHLTIEDIKHLEAEADREYIARNMRRTPSMR